MPGILALAYRVTTTTTAQRITTILVYADISAAHDLLVNTFGFVDLSFGRRRLRGLLELELELGCDRLDAASCPAT